MAFFIFLPVANSLGLSLFIFQIPNCAISGSKFPFIFTKPSAASLFVTIVLLSIVMAMLLVCNLLNKVKEMADKVMKIIARVGKIIIIMGVIVMEAKVIMGNVIECKVMQVKVMKAKAIMGNVMKVIVMKCKVMQAKAIMGNVMKVIVMKVKAIMGIIMKVIKLKAIMGNVIVMKCKVMQIQVKVMILQLIRLNSSHSGLRPSQLSQIPIDFFCLCSNCFPFVLSFAKFSLLFVGLLHLFHYGSFYSLTQL